MMSNDRLQNPSSNRATKYYQIDGDNLIVTPYKLLHAIDFMSSLLVLLVDLIKILSDMFKSDYTRHYFSS